MQTREHSRADWSGAETEPARAGRITVLSRFLRRVTVACGPVSYSQESLEKWSRYAVNATLVIVLGYLCARFTWLVVAGATLPIAEQEAVPLAPSLSGSANTQNYEIFSTFDPFFRRSEFPEKSVVDAAPETNLDLKLFGLRVGGETDDGSAIIRTPDKRQASYAVGDEITAGVVLERVLANRAIISRNGVQESLSLNPEGEAGSRVIQSSGDGSPLRGSVANSPAAAPMLSGLFSELKLAPRLLNGGINGFYIDPGGADVELLDALGLRPADILLSVNDVRLVSLERITDVIEEMKNEASFDAEIERDGSLISLTLERPAEQR